MIYKEDLMVSVELRYNNGLCSVYSREVFKDRRGREVEGFSFLYPNLELSEAEQVISDILQWYGDGIVFVGEEDISDIAF